MGVGCFNPTLVRLRLRVVAVIMRQPVWFQSHAGSIEAHYTHFGVRREFEFQSHAGSIEARKVLAGCLVGVHVSIPRWFD